MIKTVLQSKWLIPVISLVVIGFGFLVVRNLPRYFDAEKELALMKEELLRVEERAKELEENKDFAKTDAYLERQAREKLNYKMPDEKVVYIYKNQYNSESPNPDIAMNPAKSFWHKIWNWIVE